VYVTILSDVRVTAVGEGEDSGQPLFRASLNVLSAKCHVIRFFHSCMCMYMHVCMCVYVCVHSCAVFIMH